MKQSGLFVFLGFEPGGVSKKSPPVQVARITEDELEAGDRKCFASPLLFNRKSFKHSRPGHVYRIEFEDRADGGFSIYPSSSEFVGLFGTPELRAELDVEMRAFEVRQKEWKNLEDQRKTDPLDEALAPLLDIYMNISPNTRQQFIARVVYKLARRT